jgi:hypothetical protein
MKRIDGITSTKQQQDEVLTHDRELHVLKKSVSLVSKKRKESIGEIYDMLVWSVEYMRTKDQVKSPTVDLTTRVSMRYSQTLLNTSNSETPPVSDEIKSSISFQHHDDKSTTSQHILDVKTEVSEASGATHFHLLAEKLRHKYANIHPPSTASSSLDTSLANAALLQPPQLATVMDEILTQLRPIIISRSNFIAVVDSLFATGYFPPMNFILCGNHESAAKPLSTPIGAQALTRNKVPSTGRSGSRKTTVIDDKQKVGLETSLMRAERMLKTLETKAVVGSSISGGVLS